MKLFYFHKYNIKFFFYSIYLDLSRQYFADYRGSSNNFHHNPGRSSVTRGSQRGVRGNRGGERGRGGRGNRGIVRGHGGRESQGRGRGHRGAERSTDEVRERRDTPIETEKVSDENPRKQTENTGIEESNKNTSQSMEQ